MLIKPLLKFELISTNFHLQFRVASYFKKIYKNKMQWNRNDLRKAWTTGLFGIEIAGCLSHARHPSFCDHVCGGFGEIFGSPKWMWLLAQICLALFFLSTSQPQTPVINYSQRLHIPHKYRNYAGRMSSSALPKSNWSSSDSIYQLAKNNEKIMATTESTPSASRTNNSFNW